MSNHSNGLRTSSLRLLLVVLCWLGSQHNVLAQQNSTIDDTNSTIAYFPASSWNSSSGACTTLCLNPGAVTTTWHEVIAPHDPDHKMPPHTASTPNNPPTATNLSLQSTGSQGGTVPSQQSPPSNQDLSPAPDSAPPSHSAPQSSPPPSSQGSSGGSPSGGTTTQAAAAPQTSAHIGDDHNTGGNVGDKHGGHGSSGSSNSQSGGKDQRDFLDRRDADEMVTMSFNFTGSAIYVYGILPPASVATPTTPTRVDLTITLDNQPHPFTTAPAAGTTEYQKNIPFYIMTGLEDAPHQLVVNVNPNSTFIFDYMIITSNAAALSSTNTSSPPVAQNPAPSDSLKTKKHNIATFAGALGGSVGVLGLFSLGLAISIIRRRRLAAARDRRDHESLHTNSSDDSPHMSGPAPFVPRFFPGTVVPSEPPTYNAAMTNHRVENPVLVALAGSAYLSRDRSYADIPPDTPPPPSEESDSIILPPPPFPFPAGSVAASSTPPSSRPRSLAAAGEHPAHTLETEETSHQEESVGTVPSNSATAPELEPLLQSLPSHNSDRRPESRTSSRSVIIALLPPLPLSRNASRSRVNVDQEDIS